MTHFYQKLLLKLVKPLEFSNPTTPFTLQGRLKEINPPHPDFEKLEGHQPNKSAVPFYKDQLKKSALLKKPLVKGTLINFNSY